MPPGSPGRGGAAEGLPKEGVWECIGVGVDEGMFVMKGMISGVFHRPGYCTHSRGRGTEMEWFREGKPEGMFGSGQGTCLCERPGLG